MASTTDASEPSSIKLNAHEQAIIDRQLYGPRSDVVGKTTRWGPAAYANKWDIVVLTVGSITAIAAGVANPTLNIIFGSLAGTFTGFANHSISEGELRAVTAQFTLYYVYLAVTQFVLIYISTVAFYWSGERLVRRMRRAYLRAIVRQNMGFFDTLGSGKVTTHITSDMAAIQEALTSKLSIALLTFANFLSAFVISFIMYWKLALVLVSSFAAMFIATYATTPLAIKYGMMSKRFYSSGSGIAQEAIGSIRHVTAYGSQKQLADRYATFLRSAESTGIRSRIPVAVLIGWSQCLPCAAYALGFFVGALFLNRGETTVSAIVSAVGAAINGSFAVVRVIPTIESFVSGMTSASEVFEMIERESPQDPFSGKGAIPIKIEGEFELKGVELVYPSRPDTRVLKGVDLRIPANQTTAFVGLSGCGKSSILGLLERFYEPTAGSIELDQFRLEQLNLRWLRRQMAYVGQEPTLFSTSIFENIRHGLVNYEKPVNKKPLNSQQIKELVIEAAQLANAHSFIETLPEGYDTEVGEKGLALSGGQRQRIAIARAIVSDPRILLLDEATSALDTHSEKVVQSALDNAAKNRTTIVIAHRLSTIRSADNIVVMKDGRIIEQGTHEVLIAQDGAYADLVQKQQIDEGGDEKLHSMSEEAQAEGQSSKPTELDAALLDEIAEPDDVITNESTPLIRLPRKTLPTAGLPQAIRFILKHSQPERWLLVGGLLSALLAGFGLPMQGLWFGATMDAFSITDPELRTDNIRFWALVFAATGVYCAVFNFATGAFFAYSTERLSRRVRDLTLRSILRQNVAYFDEKAHSTGQMTAKLTGAPADLSSLGGAVVGSILTFVASIITSLAIGFFVGWKLSLVCAATIPTIAGLGWVRMQIIGVFDNKIRSSSERAAAYASEAVTAIRTVAATGLEDYILDGYRDIQAEQAAESFPAILKASAFFAASQGVSFLAAALVFWYGSGLIASGEYSVRQYFTCFVALIWGSSIAGALFNFAPDMSKAMLAARDLEILFNRVPQIDSWSKKGDSVIKPACQGHLRMESVSFAYPSRPGRPVLQKFNLDVPAGSFVALVGQSGCGKSTILGLLERFYDPTAGRITLDGADISTLNVSQYRKIFSLVSQEPIIFSGTIRENLLIGLDDMYTDNETSPSTTSALIAVCKAANIYSFITSLPQGFETEVGSMGSMLSGGQKQRITIARALLREPRVLILDEATAALDSESEKLVQVALDEARRGRTTVAIAHRLSTVRNADVICVLGEGKVLEMGGHEELMGRKGAYWELVRMQDLK